ncbi:MAG TPA: glycosyltransferase [Terriglobia bacterium]|nr:glycosyltransferase [Terriglobia bacterium]
MKPHPQRVVSAIIPARNEELNIGLSVRSIAAQPEILEIIAVDDQSEDHTGEVLNNLRKECPTLRVIRVDDLPEGWLGKPHALAVGASAAAGDWLLFTDADTVHMPGSLASLLAEAESQQAALLSISPGQRAQTWWERSVIPLIFTQLAALYPFDKVTDPRSPLAAANGQYILIRRSVYESIGGHAAARNAILEDVSLARRVKSMGGRLVFLPGAEWVETHMYQSFAEMWRGWTKNLFLLYGGDKATIGRTVLGLQGRWLIELALISSSAWILRSALRARGRRRASSFFMALVPLVMLAGQRRGYGRTLQQAGFSKGLAKYFLPGAPLVSLLLLSSLWAYRRSGRVEWKGRIYSVGRLQ